MAQVEPVKMHFIFTFLLFFILFFFLFYVSLSALCILTSACLLLLLASR